LNTLLKRLLQEKRAITGKIKLYDVRKEDKDGE